MDPVVVATPPILAESPIAETDGGYSVFSSFEDMQLPPSLLRGIYASGFEKPSQPQAVSIVPIKRGVDVVAQSQSGTGKTGAFAIGLLARVDVRVKGIQALVLSPTRELVLQTCNTISSLGRYMTDSTEEEPFCETFVGGTRVQDDIAKIPNLIVAVGTPGRILDIFRRKAFKSAMKILVIDEADEMLSQGFQEQIYEIFKFLPKDIQVVLVSATLPPAVLEMTAKILRPNAVKILLKQESLTLEGIKQFYVPVSDSKVATNTEVPADDTKMCVLIELYSQMNNAQAVVFVNQKREVDKVTTELNKVKCPVVGLHSDMQQSDRTDIIRKFSGGNFSVLVATDLVARGIDIPQVNIVVNYDLPASMETYLHRIGRCGRFGKTGVAINFVTPPERKLLEEIEKHFKTKVAELPLNFMNFLGE